MGGRVLGRADEDVGQAVVRRRALSSAVPTPIVWTYAALILLYVGSEIAISGWVAAFARRMAAGQGAWAYAPTAFWTAQTAGRLLAPMLLRRLSEPRLLLSSLAAAVCAVLVLSTAATSVTGVIGAAALAGFGVAAIFPLLWAGVTREESRRVVRPPWDRSLRLEASAAPCLPWLVGVVSTGYGLGTGLLVPLAALLIMLMVLAVPGPVKNVESSSVP